MKRKLIVSLFLIAAASLGCAAKSPGERAVTFGAEWGANMLFFQSSENVFLDEAGSRVMTSDKGLPLYTNGTLRCFAGIYLSDKVRLDLGTGFTGIADSRRAVPISLRANYLSGGRSSDGVTAFIDGGAGFSTLDKGLVGMLLSAGAGYRKWLCRGAGLSMMLNLRLATDHPGIISPNGSGFIPEADIKRNDSVYLSTGITVSIDF